MILLRTWIITSIISLFMPKNSYVLTTMNKNKAAKVYDKFYY